MNDRVRTLLDEARKLTPNERRELFDLLEVEFASDQDDGTEEEVLAAWLDEVERRIERSEREGTTLIDFDEAMDKARQLVR